jgi:hypothetical protein
MMSVIFAVESFSFAVYTGKESGARSQELEGRHRYPGSMELTWEWAAGRRIEAWNPVVSDSLILNSVS